MGNQQEWLWLVLHVHTSGPVTNNSWGIISHLALGFCLITTALRNSIIQTCTEFPLKPSQGCDYRSMPQCLAFYMVSEDLNSGSYAGVTGTLPTEPFPRSSECYLGWLVTTWGNEGVRNSFLMSGLTLFQYKIHCFSPLPGRLSMYQSKWPLLSLLQWLCDDQ